MQGLAVRILAALAVVAMAFAAGAYSHHRWTEVRAVKAALEASEQARKAEHDNAVSKIRAIDSYSVTMAAAQPRVLAARSDRDSVQHSFAAIAAAAPASGCEPDPRLARIAELSAEGAGLVEEGARYVEELRAKRDALIPP